MMKRRGFIGRLLVGAAALLGWKKPASTNGVRQEFLDAYREAHAKWVANGCKSSCPPESYHYWMGPDPVMADLIEKAKKWKAAQEC